MTLSTYNAKRNFSKTPEPAGGKANGSGFSYLIQKHAASHLHYDFRLELEGTLKSWAVPKGPSLDPNVKRLAVEVEDHPVDYGDFEGTIPAGEYGGGTVMLWDRGTWSPDSDPVSGLKKGKLEFEIFGEKLSGKWRLIRSRRNASKPQWLLMKRDDEEARPGTDDTVLNELPLSVLTGRTLEEIASGKKAKRLKAKAPKNSKLVAKTSQKKPGRVIAGKSVPGAKTAPMKGFLKPQLATLVDSAPEGDEWLHEIKFDGYRMQCHLREGAVSIYSRNGLSWTSKLPKLKASLSKLPAKTAILDGELVSVIEDGTTDFQTLQNAFRDKRTQSLSIYFFDLLYLDGCTLVDCRLKDRKAALELLLKEAPATGPIYYSKHIVGRGPAYAEKAEELGLEGIICKRLDSKYRSTRSDEWLKVKVVHKEEFVIGGFTAPEGSRVGLGAILIGYYDKDNRFLYGGKVGTGFDQKTLSQLHASLRKLEQNTCPFDVKASAARPSMKATWVKPKLVAQIRYGSRTRDNILRHAVFEGLREDKSAKEVGLDTPLHITKASVARKKAATPKTTSDRTTTKKIQSSIRQSPEVFQGVRLTSQEKVLYPNTKLTKLDLATYYHTMKEWILPHLAKRPLVLVRCPEGLGDSCFYQKHPGLGTPKELRLISIKEKSGTDKYAIVDDADALISLAQLGALEIHAWGSTEHNLDKPDRLIFDLDPDPSVEWKHVVEGARTVREILDNLELKSFVKTTGGKGLHVVVPIERRNTWEEAKLFSRLVAKFVESSAPERYLLNMSKAARKGKIFLDYLRNDRGSTSVAPYSPRARDGAPVSTPLAWEELSVRTRSDKFTIENINRRIAKLSHDPWEGFVEVRQSIGKGLKLLQKIIDG